MRVLLVLCAVAVTLATFSRAPTTPAPTRTPTLAPTTLAPSFAPSTSTPSESPSTVFPSKSPTTIVPTLSPTSAVPTLSPSRSPTGSPTRSPTHPTVAPTAAAGEVGIGYLTAGLAVVFFGSNFIPVKSFSRETGDGMFFQWVMCTAIFISGILVQFYLEIENPNKQTIFEPIATLGGMLWCTGNALSVPVIQCIGMGLGLLIWGAANLTAGWASSYFGILGQPKSPVPHPDLNVAGAMVCLSSLVFFFFVKTNASNDDKIVNNDEEIEERLYNGVASGTDEDDTRGLLLGKKTSRGNWVEGLSAPVKKTVGFVMAIIAGMFFGVNFNPPFYLIGPADCTKLVTENDCTYHAGKDRCMWSGVACVENPDCIHSKDAVDYVFAHFTGIFLASTAYLLIYCCVKLARGQTPQASPRIIVPGFLCGLGWAIAQISWFVANGALSPVISFPIVTTGPGLVASLWGVLVYKEIEGARNFLFLGSAFAVVVIGIILITFSKQE